MKNEDIWALKETAIKSHRYKVTMDGEEISRIELPELKIRDFDLVKGAIARSLNIPLHYLEFKRIMIVGKIKGE